MSDIFEQDIDEDGEDLSSLEDNGDNTDSGDNGNFVFPDPLYKLRLDYSCEGIYATAPAGMNFSDGQNVIVPTRYGNDLATVLGKSKKPIGIKPNDVVEIIRIADERDMHHVEELKSREKQAFETFKEKVAYHHLDMKLVATHFLVGVQITRRLSTCELRAYLTDFLTAL